MATRTTEARVRLIIDTDLDSEAVQMFIGDASLWVTESLQPLAILSAERLEIIERYLAAAFIRLKDLGLSQTTLEGTTEMYQVDKTVTDYLRRAAGLDSTGTVARYFLGTSSSSSGADETGNYPVQFKVGTGFRQSLATDLP